MIELKPCPFCGGKAKYYHLIPTLNPKLRHLEGTYVMCGRCLTSSDNYRNAELAAKAWNSRINYD